MTHVSNKKKKYRDKKVEEGNINKEMVEEKRQ